MKGQTTVAAEELPHSVALGDDSRYLFLSWLIPDQAIDTGKFKNKAVQLRYGKKYREHETGTAWCIETPLVVPGTFLYFPARAAEVPFETDRGPSERNSYIVFEEHPFGKDSTLRQLNSLPGALYVRIDLPVRSAPTDLTRKKAVEKPTAVDVPCDAFITVSNRQQRSKILDIIRWKRPQKSRWMSELRDGIAALQECARDLDVDFQELIEDWKSGKEILTPVLAETITRPDIVRSSPHKAIWDCYTEEALRQFLLPADGERGLHMLIHAYMARLGTNPWLKGKMDARDNLIERLRSGFRAYMKQMRKGTPYRPDPFSENEYYHRINDQKLVAKFQSSVRSFVQEKVLPLVMDTLNEQCATLARVGELTDMPA